MGLDLFMVLYKAGKNNPQIKEWGLAFQIPVAWGISAVLAGIFYVFLGPFLKKRIAAKFDVDADVELSVAEEAVPAKGIDSTEKTKAEDTNEGETETEKPKAKKSLANMAASSMKKFADSTINRDIEAEGQKEIFGRACIYLNTYEAPCTPLTLHDFTSHSIRACYKMKL